MVLAWHCMAWWWHGIAWHGIALHGDGMAWLWHQKPWLDVKRGHKKIEPRQDVNAQLGDIATTKNDSWLNLLVPCRIEWRLVFTSMVRVIHFSIGEIIVTSRVWGKEWLGLEKNLCGKQISWRLNAQVSWRCNWLLSHSMPSEIALSSFYTRLIKGSKRRILYQGLEPRVFVAAGSPSDYCHRRFWSTDSIIKEWRQRRHFQT